VCIDFFAGQCAQESLALRFFLPKIFPLLLFSGWMAGWDRLGPGGTKILQASSCPSSAFRRRIEA